MSVQPGATLTIEPGTLVRARGPNAAIIVEPGARIEAQGRRDAPIVMTCDAPIARRKSGCWSGLFIKGSLTARINESIQESLRSSQVYGMSIAHTTGTLRYVRVEYAGAPMNPWNLRAAITLQDLGDGTDVEFLQVHSSASDGIVFVGGTVSCHYCVSSDAAEVGLRWDAGWQGMAKYLYVRKGHQSGPAIADEVDGFASAGRPRSKPFLSHVTLVGGSDLQRTVHGVAAMRLGSSTELTAQNGLVTGFSGPALDVHGLQEEFFSSAASTFQNAMFHANGLSAGFAQVRGIETRHIDYADGNPLLRNIRPEANPDPRPRRGSQALQIPGDSPLGTNESRVGNRFIGAFGLWNWLDEWTFFGDEADHLMD